MQRISSQKELNELLADINSAGGLLREAHLLSSSYLIEDDGKVYSTSGQGGDLLRILLTLCESENGAVELVLEGVSQSNIPSGLELHMHGEVNDFQASIRFGLEPADGFVNAKKVYFRYHDRSVWGERPYYAKTSPLDEEGNLVLEQL